MRSSQVCKLPTRQWVDFVPPRDLALATPKEMGVAPTTVSGGKCHVGVVMGPAKWLGHAFEVPTNLNCGKQIPGSLR